MSISKESCLLDKSLLIFYKKYENDKLNVLAVFLLCTLIGFSDVHLLCIILLMEGNPGSGEIAQWVTEFIAKSHNLSFIPGTDCPK